MYWFITFPNEPLHPLHEKMVDFETVINLAIGNISSQIPQMSRIHKMMKRYSNLKAKQFLARFPTVYWAPDEKLDRQVLYFYSSPVNKSVKEAGQCVAWWKTDDLSRISFMTEGVSEIKDLHPLNIGREFKLYFDMDAGCHLSKWSAASSGENTGSHDKISKVDKGIIVKNKLIRKHFNTKYSWQHDSHPNLLNWIKENMPGYLNSEMEIVSLSNTYLEIQEQGKVLGMIMIIDYVVFLTQLNETGSDEMIFVTYPDEVIAAAAQDGIKLIYTNKL